MLNNLPILYSFVRCPYAIRARMALLEAKINCVVREVNLKEKPSEMLKASPKGTVPILILNDGTIIDESMEIIHHALADHESLSLNNFSAEEIQQINSMINSNDTEFVKLLKAYKYPERYPDQSVENCKQEIQDKFLDKYEAMLDNQSFLLGKKSIADIGILSFIRQLSKVDQEWFFNSKYKNIIRWLKSFTETADFENIIMAKHEHWKPSNKPVYMFSESQD